MIKNKKENTNELNYQIQTSKERSTKKMMGVYNLCERICP